MCTKLMCGESRFFKSHWVELEFKSINYNSFFSFNVGLYFPPHFDFVKSKTKKAEMAAKRGLIE